MPKERRHRNPVHSREHAPSGISRFDNDMRFIAEEIRRSGAIQNKAEQQLWQSAYQHRRQVVPVTEETLPQVGTYLKQTIGTMSNSRNKYFRHAADVIGQQSQIQLLRVSVDESLSVAEREAFAAVHTVIEDNRFQFVLHIDGGQVLNNSNGLSLAIALTHEAQHLEDRFAFQNSLPRNLSFQERVERQTQKRQSNPVSDEAGAYATQAEALIESLRLATKSEMPEDFIHIAAAYIRAGKNRDTQAWKNYIASRVSQK